MNRKKKLKTAVINAFYDYGSTGKGVVVTKKRFEQLGFETRVYYGLKKNTKAPQNVIYIGNSFLSSLEYRFSNLFGTHGMLCFFQTFKLLRNLKKFKPDIVWLNNIHDDYVNEFILLNYLKKNNIFCVYGMVDEYAFLGRCCSVTDCTKYKDGSECKKCPHRDYYPTSKWIDTSHLKYKLKQKVYDNFNNMIFRTAPYVIKNARNSLLLKGKIFWESDSSVDIENIYHPQDANDLRAELGIDEEKRVVLLCAPFSDKLKGAHYFLKAAKLCENEQIIFINVAFDGDKSCCPSNFIPLPYEKDKTRMAKLYSLADAYVCTSISDAQPNTCLEALGCGTPIIGFNISGVPYTAPNEYGTFVKPMDVEALARAIKNVQKKTRESIRGCHFYAKI